ncbi:hypothetical protein B0H14DRAFT_2559599 [Mycena olivaceomarginata]|nr:hypothetical protein B0H14DRAFT_2559599 [Mycena olivaceomarginata]
MPARVMIARTIKVCQTIDISRLVILDHQEGSGASGIAVGADKRSTFSRCFISQPHRYIPPQCVVETAFAGYGARARCEEERAERLTTSVKGSMFPQSPLRLCEIHNFAKVKVSFIFFVLHLFLQALHSLSHQSTEVRSLFVRRGKINCQNFCTAIRISGTLAEWGEQAPPTKERLGGPTTRPHEPGRMGMRPSANVRKALQIRGRLSAWGWNAK